LQRGYNNLSHPRETPLDAHVILNPTAGQTRTSVGLDRALDALSAHGWTLCVRESQARGDVTRLAAAAARDGAEAVIVVGGDGTLSEAANGLAGTDTALGLLPMGTGNVWAAQLGMVASPTLLNKPDLLVAAENLAASRPRRVDMGQAHTIRGDRYFLLWAGVGLDAIIQDALDTQARPVKRRFGQMAYVWAAARPIIQYQGTRARVQLDTVRTRGRVVFLVISNVQMYAGFHLVPEAQIDDGWLDIAIFEGHSWLDSLRHIGQLAVRRHLDDPAVRIYRAREVVVEADPSLLVHYDGDALGATPLIARVAPQALTVLVPPSAPADLFATPS